MKQPLTKAVLLAFVTLLAIVSVMVMKEKSSGDKAFFAEVINHMQTGLINKDELDWPHITKQIDDLIDQGKERQFIATQLLKLIDTNHTSIRNKDRSLLAFYSELKCNFDKHFVDETSIPNDVGYLRVNGFSQPDRASIMKFAEDLQDHIQRQDDRALKAWIVDLRYNAGGNMYPMMAGIGPLLGNITAGHFSKSESDKSPTPYGYSRGSATIGPHRVVTLDPAYEVKNANIPIYVLTSERTSSSGEAIAIAFKKHPLTKQVGTKTCGMATANRTIKLSDGSLLALTGSYMTDRENRFYPNGVEPDLTVDAESALSKTLTLIEAEPAAGSL